MTGSTKKKVIFYTAAVLFTLLIAEFAWLRKGAPSITTSVAETRALGVPTTFEELAERVPKEGEDADLYYARAENEWRKGSAPFFIAYQSISAPGSVQQRASAEKILKGFLNDIEKGAQCPRWSITPVSPRHYSKYSDKAQRVAAVNSWARFLCDSALSHANSHEDGRALEELQLAASISKQLSDNPGLTPKLTSIATEGQVIEGFKTIILGNENDPVLLAGPIALAIDATASRSLRSSSR